MNNLLLSVIIPAYNEEDRIGSTLGQIVSYLQSRNLNFELLVIDDGSQDQTSTIVRQFSTRKNLQSQVHVNRYSRNRGKGYAVRHGMLLSKGDYALLTDADLSTPIEEISKLEKEVIHGSADIAFGSRDIEGSRIEVHQSWIRETGGKIFNRIMRLIVRLPFRDTQCGFKLFQMNHCKTIFQKQSIEGFGFDVEILYIARKWGMKIKEVPVVWKHQEGSQVHLPLDAITMLWDLFKIKWADWQDQYEHG